ncbi:MAG: DNA polymerase I [bacterium]|nr:DNA polymerase I [bacterium]
MAQKKSNKKTLVLLDAHAILHRAYHALPPFTSPEGLPTGALYGFASMILKIIRELQPDYIAAAYDLAGPTFRHVAYKDYKGTRAKTDDALIAQFDVSRDLLQALNIPAYSQEGFEADDIIGTIVEKTKQAKDISVIIASGDLDALQLVQDKKVQVYTLRKGIQDTVLYDETAVKERFGFSPEFLLDYKGLRGDASDNIPGVRGIGEKTASLLIQTFGALEHILSLAKNNPETLKKAGITDRIAGLLRDQEEQALFSKELASIKRDVPISFSLEDAAHKDGVPEGGIAFLKKLGFTSIIARLNGTKEVAKNETKDNASAVSVLDKRGWKILASAKELFWCMHNDTIFAVTDAGEVFSLAVKKIAGQKKDITALFKKGAIRHAFDSKALMHAFDAQSIAVSFQDDLQILFWLKDPRKTDPTVADLFLDFDSAGGDIDSQAAALPGIYRALFEEIKKKDLVGVYRDIELPLVPVLFAMEKRGIRIHAPLLMDLGEKTKKEIKRLEKEIHALAGEEFLINSPKELSRVLFDVLGISAKGVKKTGTGQRSTRFSELTKIAGLHPIIEKIISYREVGKIHSTYISVLPDLADEKGRIHTSFHQTGTVTGRFSSSDPNMQNIPTRSDLGDKIRQAFIPSDGMMFLACDYSQIQLRIAALLSGEDAMLSVFKRGEDIHSATASRMFGVGEKDITSEMRRRAKIINFGILYGMGVQALSANLKVSRDEASLFLDNYFKQYPKLFRYFESVKEQARSKGYVETLFGRKRFLPEINSRIIHIEREAERMAMNAPIQGSEADMIKKAMSGVSDYIEKDKRMKGHAHLLLQIHDELLFEAEKEIVSYAVEKLALFLESIYPNKYVDFPVETKIGPTWADLKSTRP